MMPDDLTLQYRRLAHTAALIGDYADHPERQAELLQWTLEAVRAIAAARGLPLPAILPCAGCGVPAFDGVCAVCEAEAERGSNALNRQEHAGGLHPEGCTCQAHGSTPDEEGPAERARQPEPMPPHISRDMWPAQGKRGEARESPVAWDIDGDVPRLVPLEPDLVGCTCQQWPRPAAGHGPPYWTHHHNCPSAALRNRAAEGQRNVEAGAGFAPGELARAGGGEEREQ